MLGLTKNHKVILIIKPQLNDSIKLHFINTQNFILKRQHIEQKDFGLAKANQKLVPIVKSQLFNE